MSDRKIAHNPGNNIADYYTADVVSASDYYPFGMQMVGRKFDGGRYRYGFNGLEKDRELKNGEDDYYTLNRNFDSRIGRWFSIDPIIKHGETPYGAFHNNPIIFNDPFGDDPPKKPGFWTKIWRSANNDYYKNRAEEYAIKNKIDEKNIIDAGNDTWVIINDNDKDNVRFSVFRKVKPGSVVGLTTSPKNDDLNLTEDQLQNTRIKGSVFMDAPIGGPASAARGIAMGAKSKSAIVGIVDKTADALEGYKKYIRFGVSGHPDVLNKGFHLHFDDVAKNLELGLVPTQGGGIGLIQVGKKAVGTADEVKKAVSLFNKAMASSKFRAELLVRLKVTQEYLQQTFKFTKSAQQAVDKSHELNYLIKAVSKF